jgi:cytochrome c-type biogenesis protein CcmH/NrfG
MTRTPGLLFRSAAVTLLYALAGGAAGAQTAAPDSPEAIIERASRSMQQGDADRAIAEYERALAIINGPTPAATGTARAERWKAYEPIIRFSLATLHAARGVDHFQANGLPEAIAAFRTSLGWNPYARDIWYNLSQALYIQASQLREHGEAAGDLTPVYNEILAAARKVREADPANSNVLLLIGHTYRWLGEEALAEAAFGAQAALRLEVDEVRMEVGPDETLLSGAIENVTLAAGERVRLRFTMLTLAGQSMTASEVETVVPPPGEAVRFALSIETTEDVAGWRYEVLSPAR